MEREIRRVLDEIRELSMVDDIYWRASYTKQDSDTKAYLIELMKSKGIDGYLDPIGNVIGFIKGSEETIITIGSHVDTVRNGGEFDGMYGVLCGIYAVESLIKEYGKPKHNIMIAGFVEEEGSRFLSGYTGSKGAVGLLSDDDLKEVDKDGVSLANAMKLEGLDTILIPDAKWKDVSAFFEIHIEQGPILETSNKQIGIVDSITGIKVLRINIVGRQDHAGTTPMDVRLDALKEACHLVISLDNQRFSKEYHTITIGEMEVRPGSSNVVPGHVTFSVDIRSGSQDILNDIEKFIKGKLKIIQDKGFEVAYSLEADEEPVVLDKDLLRDVKEVLDGNKDYIIMTSGAGHDAQIIAPRIPTSLLFIPCIGGRSHTPEEAVHDKDIRGGIDTMRLIILKKAWGMD